MSIRERITGPYEYDGKMYRVLVDYGSMKHPDTGEWIPSVTYYSAKEPKKVYTMDMTLFMKRFKKVK
jgi:hypothetical protein